VAPILGSLRRTAHRNIPAGTPTFLPSGKERIAARERLRAGVEAALLSLGGGFVGHPIG
jgi:hypothetical protein